MSEFLNDAQEEHIKKILLGEKATSPEEYFNSSVGFLNGSNKQQPYNYELATKKFKSWVYAAANVNAKRAASVPIRMYAKRPTNGQKYIFPTKKLSLAKQKYLAGELEETPSASVITKANSFLSEYEEILEHPVLTLLKKVNPFMNGFEFTYARFLYLELLGNSYFYVVNDNNNIPAELWILPAQDVTIEPSKTDFIDGYYYGADRAKQIKLSTDEVIHTKYFNPDDLFYGKGKVEAAWDVVGVNEQEHKFRHYLYSNMARPDYAIIMKGLENNQVGLTRYSKYLESMFKGASNSGKFVALPADIELKPLTFAPKDLGKNDDMIITEICSVFGTPISKIKMNDANYSNAAEGNVSWLRDTIKPMLRIDEEVLNQELLPLYGIGEDAFLAYDNPIPADADMELKKTTQYVTYGIITPNEGRASIGLPPIDGYDNLHYQGVPLNQPTPAPEPVEEEPIEEPEEVEEEPVEPTEEPVEEEKSIQKEIHVHINNNMAMDVDELKNLVIDELNKKEAKEEYIPNKLEVFLSKYMDEKENLKALDDDSNLVKKVEDVFSDYFNKQKKASIAYLEKNPAKAYNEDDLEDVLLSFNDGLVKTLQKPLSVVLEAGAVDGLKEIGFNTDVFNVQNPKVQESLEKRNIKLAGNVSDETISIIKNEIKNALDEGLSNAQLAKKISESTAFNYERSMKISRTEVADVYEEGSHEAWDETGEVKGSEWVLSNNACEICREIKATTGVVPLGKNFVNKGDIVAGHKMDYKDIKSPVAHPNCRCTTRAVLKGD